MDIRYSLAFTFTSAATKPSQFPFPSSSVFTTKHTTAEADHIPKIFLQLHKKFLLDFIYKIKPAVF
jgi:hypothetical protein